MKLKVGLGSCGIAAGGGRVKEALEAAGYLVEPTGCIGLCYFEPILDVADGGEVYSYGQVTPALAVAIAARHAAGQGPLTEALGYTRSQPPEVLRQQTRIVLENCGVINPEKLSDYIDAGGYAALRQTLAAGDALALIDEIKAAGLRGRGGAGFPTWFKWNAAREAAGQPKYVICNADEGDPGAFMDRSVLEGDPHRIIEGMAVCGFAIGASSGMVYCRAEYPLAVARLQRAIDDARAAGFLGKNILGSGFDFDIQIQMGAGAFVCGEETALIASLEGRRGMPRPKPPFPAQSGYAGCPTNINNVETFACVPWILRHGVAAFAAVGTEKSAGTKVFALSGKVRRGGLVEIPMGVTLRKIFFDIGGGIKNDRPFKAVQLGGPSGGSVPAAALDTPVTYEDIAATGAIVGSGGMVVMDADTCMVDVARFFMDFCCKESCGKCVYCRIGTRRMWEILDRITKGESSLSELAELERLAAVVRDASLCGLGQTAPGPVLTSLRYFREEYLAHIEEKTCPAGVCRALVRYEIDPAKCVGCRLCAGACPVGAITGAPRQAHRIDPAACIRCGSCLAACRVGAVHTGGRKEG